MKLCQSLFALSCALSSVVCFAEGNSRQVDHNMPQQTVSLGFDSKLTIGGNYSYVNFQPKGEDNPGFHGNLGGVQAIYEYQPMNRFYGALQAGWKQGHTKGTAGQRSFLYFDVQERLGYTIASESHNWIAFYSGFGYRYVGQHLHSSSDNSVRFGYNEFYFPVGFTGNYTATSWFSLGLEFTWMPQVFSTVSLVPLKGAYWKLSRTLENFYGALPFIFTLTEGKQFVLTFKPFYEFWRDGHTTARLSTGVPLGLPGNTYQYYGADLNFAYCF